MRKLYFCIFVTLSFVLISCGSTKNATNSSGSAKLTREEKYIQKGDNFLSQGQYDDAVESFKKVLVKNPESELALQKLAKFYYEQGDWINAIKYYEQLLNRFPENQEYNCKCGLSYFFLGYEQYSYTSIFPKKVPRFHNSEIDSYIYIYYGSEEERDYAVESQTINGGRKGNLYMIFENSLNYLLKAISISPTWESYFGMGLLYSKFDPLNLRAAGGTKSCILILGNEFKSKEFFLKSIEIEPSWQAYYAYDKLELFPKIVNTKKFSEQERKETLNFLGEGIKVAVSDDAPDYVLYQLYDHRGYFYEKIGDFYAALEDYQKANDKCEIENIQRRLADEKTAKELGFKSVSAYYDYQREQERIKKEKEDAKKRITYDNFYSYVTYHNGVPLKIGDNFTIPASRLEVVDRVNNSSGYVYLVTFWVSAAQQSIDYAQSFFGGGQRYCFYIKSRKELKLENSDIINVQISGYRYITNRNSLKIKCAGTGQYARNFQNVDCCIFELVEEVAN